MEANFWHERWSKNEIGWHESEFNPLLTGNFHRLQLAPGSRVFVPLCGKTRDIVWLLHDEARIMDGEAPLDAAAFATRLTRVMSRVAG